MDIGCSQAYNLIIAARTCMDEAGKYLMRVRRISKDKDLAAVIRKTRNAGLSILEAAAATRTHIGHREEGK